jgi:hypothetical protein
MMASRLAMRQGGDPMNTIIQRRSKSARQILGTAVVVMSTSIAVMFTPTKASAFDIGGLIGTAMALQMGQYHGGYSSGGHSRTHVASRRDSDSGDNNGSGVERDARDPVAPATTSSGKPDNRVAARGQKIQGPSSLSGGIAQASERDASAGELASSGKSFDDGPAFNPSR